MCSKAYSDVKELLKNKAQEVKKLAARLLEKETVELDELTKLLGKREGGEKQNLAGYVKDLAEKREQPIFAPATAQCGETTKI